MRVQPTPNNVDSLVTCVQNEDVHAPAFKDEDILCATERGSVCDLQPEPRVYYTIRACTQQCRLCVQPVLKDEGARGAPVFKDEGVRGPPVFKDEGVRGPPVFKDEGARGPPVCKSVGIECGWLCSFVSLLLIPTTPPIHPQFNSHMQHNHTESPMNYNLSSILLLRCL